MKRMLVALLAFAACGSAFAAEPMPRCEFDPSESVKRVSIGIKRTFDPDEIFVERFTKIYGSIGTAWFLDKRTIVTIAHVATGAKLTGHWKEIRLFWSDEKDQKAENSLVTRARIKDIVTGIATLEPLITLEIEHEVPGAQIARLKESSLRRNEPVIGWGYKDGELRFAIGRVAFPEPLQPRDFSSSPPPPPYLPFEIMDPNKARSGSGNVEDRYVFDYGASGTPIFDCEGNVAAVVQGALSQTVTFFGMSNRVSTPWGHANNTGVSIIPLFKLR